MRAMALFLLALSSSAAQVDSVRLRTTRSVAPGPHTVVVSLYATAESEIPLASESHTVIVDDAGGFSTRFDTVSALGAENEERWLGVRLLPGVEGPRRRVTVSRRWPVRVLVVTDAAITADGIIESIDLGFRFPDGTVQSTASTATSGFGSPLAVGSANADGVSNATSRADHVHAHGTHTDGALHAVATPSVAGFLSAADKTKLDGTSAYVRTFIVSPVIGDAAASGTALINALAGITGSASSPALLKIEPGVYDIGNATLTMKTYVDIEGSGQNATFITAARSHSSGAATINSAAVGSTAANAEIRNLTITNTGSGLNTATGYFGGSAGGSVRDVTINVSGGTVTSIGMAFSGSSPDTIINTTIKVTGTSNTRGIQVHAATVVIRNCSSTASDGVLNIALYPANPSAVVTVEGSTFIANGSTGNRYGLWVNDGTARVYNSVLRAEGTGVATLTGVRTTALSTALVYVERSSIHGTTALNEQAPSTLQVATSLVDGVIAGSPTCIYNYDAAFAAVSCP